MNPSSLLADGSANSQVLWEDGERIFSRVRSLANADGSVLTVLPATQHPTPAILDRLANEYGLKEELDRAWAVRPLELIRDGGRTILVLEDPGGEPLQRSLGEPLEIGHFLRLAIDITVALGKLHGQGLLHRDIKPANFMVNCADGQARLTGFGIASRVPRERPVPGPPETIAGTLAYMAPEQTGRMNRSIDSRSDLYALGVTFYQMLTGSLPFAADDPMEWVHCHIARKPAPPSERSKNIPVPVSEIVMKLLAKTAEERYQSAGGVESDLRYCLGERECKGSIASFALGERDGPDRLLLPEKLYGRAREIQTLLSCFDRIAKDGATELVLVSGYSGIGKSSVVNELHKVLVESRGLFASGKFDQYKRDIPYSTLAQAFQSLIRPLLAKRDPELAGWREAFCEALGPNGRLIVDLAPELKLIIGDQPSVAELPPHDARRRFQLVFRRFLGVFARPEHPLVLFLDDLQWLDSATLDLLEDLFTQPDVQHLMLIGAYRDNEVDSAHPLIRKLEAIRKADAVVHEIILAPLAREELGRLIGDALHCEPERVTALTGLIHDKTAGNPFFANQLISVLVEEGLLTFDYGEGRWSWDLSRIHGKSYTDNVVDLMVGKVSRLPVETQRALQLLACMGNSAECTLLEMVSKQPNEEMHDQLLAAVRSGLVFRTEQSYTFVHDRIQEAAYSLIPEEARAETHLRIGRLLATCIAAEEREEAIFEIVNQLNRGAALITAQDEREQLAELNLVAGKRAKASTAYAAAQTYITAGCALLPEDCWEHCYALTFSLEFHLAECEFLIGALATAENRLAMLSSRAGRLVEESAVTCLRVSLYTALDRSDRAVEVCLDYLRQAGIQWSAHPTNDEIRQEYERIWQQIGGRPIEDLADLPPMTDPECRATLDVLAAVLTPALFTDENLLCLVVSRMANLSLEHGNSDGSCLAYVWVGSLIAGLRFSDYQAAFRFGRLGYDLVEQRGLKRFQARTYMNFGNVVLPWTRHVRAGRDPLRRAFEAANQSGDLNFAAYCCNHLITNLFAAGDPLDEVQGEAERGLAFAQKIRFGLVIDVNTSQLGLIRTLRGLTPTFGSFDEEGFDESLFERHLANNAALALAEDRYWIRKLQARFFAGAYASAIAASENAERLLWTSRAVFERAEYHFYAALARAAVCNAASAAERAMHLEALAIHFRLLQEWADNCPENFANRAALVAAEIARLEGRELDAEHLYEAAIRSARENGFIHNEALAYELAARFYAARGFKQIADLYLRNARYGYLRWGALGKVRQLDEAYRDLIQEDSLPSPTNTIGTPVEHLDLATVIKVSQAVSGEIVLENLIDTLMRTAMAQAGAERALLIVTRGQEPRIEAEATTNGATVTVRLVDEAVTERVLPESVLHYVLRTREIVMLDDAAARSPFGVDSYIRQRQARSILCLPLLNQANLVGVLYLENSLSPRVFAPARVPVLKLLASQAAIALENAHLYREVAERETKIRRLVDSNIIGIFIWDFDGRVVEANDEFLRMVNYDREDLVSGRIKWTDLTPPDWRERDNAKIEQHKISGRLEPFEKEYTRRDGSRVPVLIGGATFEEGGNQGVAFVLDLTERKCAEQALVRSEAYLTETQKLTHTGSWAWDARNQKVVYCSEEMFRIYGLDPQKDLPTRKNFRQRVHPEDRSRVDERFARVVNEKVDSFDEYRVLLPDGTVKHINSSGHPVLDGNGEFIEFIGTATDVTERKCAEKALRESEYKLRQIIDAVPGFVWSSDPAGEPTNINQHMSDYSGMRFEDFLNGGWEAFVHPADFPETARAFYHAIQNGTSYQGVQRLRRADGEFRWYHVRSEPLRDRQGNIIQWYGLSVDIDEAKKAEDRLRRSETYLAEAQLELAHANRVATMGQLTSSIAHEVNQPITAAVTYALAARRFLNAEPPNFREVDDALSLIVKEGSRAGAVIGRIRALIEKAPPRRDAVEINDAILEAVALTRREAASKSVSVRTQLSDGLPRVQGDRVQLQQVLLNLIINAIEAMRDVGEEERTLLISTRNGPDGVSVEVRDSGQGFAPAALERVFEAFYTTKPGGLGLGLSICRSIIEAHGGRLWASPNVPRGAVFRFTAPAHPAAASNIVGDGVECAEADNSAHVSPSG